MFATNADGTVVASLHGSASRQLGIYVKTEDGWTLSKSPTYIVLEYYALALDSTGSILAMSVALEHGGHKSPSKIMLRRQSDGLRWDEMYSTKTEFKISDISIVGDVDRPRLITSVVGFMDVFVQVWQFEPEQ